MSYVVISSAFIYYDANFIFMSHGCNLFNVILHISPKNWCSEQR